MDRFIQDEEQVGIHLTREPRGQVLQVTMGSYQRYWSLIGYELIGPAPKLFKDPVPVRRKLVQSGLFVH